MSERQQIVARVSKLRRRRRGQQALDGAARGLFWGACASAVLLLAAKLWILPLGAVALGGLPGEEVLTLAMLAAGMVSGATVGLLERLSLLNVANDIDVRLGLRERVSSALALDPNGPAQPFVAAVVHDAAVVVTDLPLRTVYPWGLPQAWQRTALALGIALALSFCPQLNWFTRSSDRAEAKLIQESGKSVLELAKQVEKEAEQRKDPELKQVAKEIKRVGERLNSQQLHKKDALKELQRLSDKLQTQAQNKVTPGQKALEGELAQQLKQLSSTRELGDMLDKNGTKSLLSQMNKVMQDLAQGKLSDKDMKQLGDMSKAIREALQKKAASDPGAQALKQQLDKLDKAIQQSQAARQQLAQTLQKFQQDLNKLTQNMQQNKLGQQSQQLSQLGQQLQQQMQQQGSLSQQTLQQMQQSLQQSMQQMQQMQQNGQLSQQQAQQLQQQAQQVLGYMQPQQGKPGQQGQQQQGQGQLSQDNQQAQQGNQQLGQQMGQMSQSMGQGGGQPSMGEMLSQQIAQMKQQLGYSQMTQGTAGSGWGDGTSPYAVSPAPAPNKTKGENRQGKGLGGDRTPTEFEPLYEGQDVGHAFGSQSQLHGKLDLTKPPQKVDEVRSAPETQAAMQGYANIIGSYASGEENAITQEQVPQEYQDLVKQYFDQLQKDAKRKK